MTCHGVIWTFIDISLVGVDSDQLAGRKAVRVPDPKNEISASYVGRGVVRGGQLPGPC
jgi:hypothetical protein